MQLGRSTRVVMVALGASIAAAAGCSILADDDLSGRSSDAGTTDGGGSTNDDAGTTTTPGIEGGATVDVAAAGSSKYAAAVLADAPVAYWRLGDPEGTLTPKNMIGESYGKLIGSLALGAAGALVENDTALKLSGYGHADFENRFDFSGDVPMAIEAWVDAAGPEGNILGKQNGADGEGWNLFLWSESETSPVIRFDRLKNWNERTFCIFRITELPATILGDGQFHHIVLSYDTINTRIYVDGVERHNCPNPSLTIGGTDAGLTFGGINGRIDEVALYDHMLTPPRVRAHFEAAH